MATWNECIIYDVNYDSARSGDIQCRSLPIQRPCGSSQCTRPECSRARESASAVGTTHATENDVTGSESTSQATTKDEPLKSLHGLADADLQLLARALTVLRKTSPAGMDYRHVDTLRAKVLDVWMGP